MIELSLPLKQILLGGRATRVDYQVYHFTKWFEMRDWIANYSVTIILYSAGNGGDVCLPLINHKIRGKLWAELNQVANFNAWFVGGVSNIICFRVLLH